MAEEEKVTENDEELNWNPQWLSPLRDLAKQVISRHNATYVDVDELVNVAWSTMVCRFPKEYDGGIINSRAVMIKGRMLDYIYRFTSRAYGAGVLRKNVDLYHDEPDVGDALNDPHDHVAAAELVDLVSILYTRLGARAQGVLMLLVQSYTQDEIGQRLAMSRRQVRWDVDMIRMTMTTLMEGE